VFLTSDAYRTLDETELRAWDWSATTILYVSFAWDPASTGAQQLSGRRVVKTLLAAGARVHVLTAQRAAEDFSSGRYRVTVVPPPPFPANKIGRAFRMVQSTVPEAEGGWVRRAVDAGMDVCSSLPSTTVIYSRAMPGASNVAAWHLSQRTGLPWVAHFSDEWPGDQLFARGRAWLAPYKRPLFQLWRRRIVRDAGALTFTNPDQGRDFLRDTGDRYHHKSFVVTHLPTHPGRCAVAPQFDVFHIVHTGNFYPPDQTSRALMQGIRRFLDATPAARGKVRFTQAGWCDGDMPEWTMRGGLGDVVRRAGRLDQRGVDDLLAAASLLVAIDYARPSTTMLSKLPDYVNARRPILAISAPTSSLGRFFLEDGAGLAAHYDDPGQVAAQIGKVFDAWLRRDAEAYLPERTAIESFMPSRVLGELAGAFTVARRRSRTAELARADRVGLRSGRERRPATWHAGRLEDNSVSTKTP
jgi:hypothetical protein